MNSHDIYRESKQTDKSLVELASKSWPDEVKDLLVELLNKYSHEVKDAHSSEKGKELLKTIQPNYLARGDGVQDADYDTASDNDVDASTKGLRPRNSIIDYKERNKLDASDDEDPDFEVVQSSDDDGEENEQYEGNEEDDKIESKLHMRDLFMSKKKYSGLDKLVQESLDQDEFSLRVLLSMQPDKKYSREDLEVPVLYERALRLLNRERFGTDSDPIRLSPHIRYDRFYGANAKELEKKMELEKRDLAEYAKEVNDAEKAAEEGKGKGKGKANTK
jgi:hypothetical protein